MFEHTKNILKFKPFTMKEILVFSALILSNIFIIYYLLGNYILEINNYNIYFLNPLGFNGNNVILKQIYQFIVFSELFSLIIHVTIYII